LEYETCDIVTHDWSFMMDDMLRNNSQYIQLGTGGMTRQVLAFPCICPAGTRILDGGYPDWDSGEEGEIEYDTITYRAVFPPGSVKIKRGRIGINEVYICPGGDPPEFNLVYGRFVTALPVRACDTLRVRAEISCSTPKAEYR
jgi:hypothetical protein